MNVPEIVTKVNTEIISPVYLVGGSVRDLLRGKTPTDYDFATPHSVDEVEEGIRKSVRRAYQIGNSKRHGTIACKIDGHEVQITTFRKETYVEGSRQPQVTFVTDLEEDLSRRDFTMNAIAVSPAGSIIDPFGGYAAIQCEWIATVGDACERLQEDPLRMLRAYRFQATFGYAIDFVLRDAIRQQRSSLLTVSKERWVLELDKLLYGTYAAYAVRMLVFDEVFQLMFPHIETEKLEELLARASPEDRWRALLYRCVPYKVYDARIDDKHWKLFQQDIIKMYCQHFKFSKARTELMLQTI